MNKRKIIIFIILGVLFWGLGVMTYQWCERNYLSKLISYNNTLKYIEQNPEIASEYPNLKPPAKPVATELYAKILRWTPAYNVQLFYVVIIIIVSTYSFHLMLHSGFIQNISFRKPYHYFIRNCILKAQGVAILLFLIPHLFIFIICLFYSDFQWFDMNSVTIGEAFYNNYLLFFSSFLYFLLYAVLCCNIGLIAIKKQKRFAVSVLMSSLIYLFIIVYLEAGIGNIIDNLASINYHFMPFSSYVQEVSIFSILPYYYLLAYSNHWVSMLIMVICVIITMWIVYLLYSDKESVMIEIQS